MTCANCGKPAYGPRAISTGDREYCGQECYDQGEKRDTETPSMFEEGEDGC